MSILTKISTLIANNSAAKNAIDLISPFGNVYVVGDTIRDLVLNRKPKEFDIATSVDKDTIRKVLENFKNAKFQSSDKDKSSFIFNYEGKEVHILPLKTDIKRYLSEKDFTANAIAVNPKTEDVVDPFDGTEDIEKGILRVVRENSLKDNPIASVKALSLISEYGLQPEEETLRLMEESAYQIKNIDLNLIGKELDRIAKGEHPHEAITIGHKTNVLDSFLPEVHSTFGFDQQNPHHFLDLGSHLMEVLKNMSHLSSEPDLRIAALLHDIGKPESMWVDEKGVGHFYYKDGQGQNHEDVGAEMAEDILKRLHFPADRIAKIKRIIQNHMFPVFNSSKGARKFLNLAGSHDDAHDLITLKEADHMGKGNEQATRTMADRMRELIDDERNKEEQLGTKDLVIDGNDIMATLGLDAGPEVGQILKHLTDVIAENPEMNTKPNLLTFVNNFYKNSKNLNKISLFLKKEAAWRDVEMKAKRLKDDGQVNIINNFPNVVDGMVKGDNGTYETIIYRENPESNSISHWTCECDWGKYAWGRTRKWQKFEGRPCSHVMAMYWQSRSVPVGYHGEEQPAGETFSFEPDQPNYEVTNQEMAQAGQPETVEQQEQNPAFMFQVPEEPNIPEPPKEFGDDLLRKSKWKRI